MFSDIVAVGLPKILVEGLFQAFDQEQDGHR